MLSSDDSQVSNGEGNCPYVEAIRASLVAQRVKRLPTIQETQVQSLGQEDPLEKGMQSTIYSSILVWRIPCTEESGELQSMGSQVIDTT